MAIYEVKDMNIIEPFFQDWPETFIWSCLQGYMGNAYCDDLDNPQAAQIVLGDFCLLAGKPNKELAGNKPPEHQSGFLIIAPRDTRWNEVIEEHFKNRAVKRTRYATKKEGHTFDRQALEKIVDRLPAPYEIKKIDGEIYKQVLSVAWSKDLCSQFKNYGHYQQLGLGFVVMSDKDILSGASSYAVYREGIEIEVDTREDARRQGLALACGARLILECLNRNLYPSWDAHNKASLALAEKLGYHFDREYPVYEING